MITILLQKILDFISNKFTTILSLLTSISEKDFAPVVEDITDQLVFDDTTTEATNRLVQCYKYGNIVFLQGQQLQIKGYISPGSGDFVFLSGLPKPKTENGVNDCIINLGSKNAFKVRITEDGTLNMWYQEAYDGTTFYNNISYVCDDSSEETPETPDDNELGEG